MSTDSVVQSLVNAEAAIEEAKAQVEAKEELAQNAALVEKVAVAQAIALGAAAGNSQGSGETSAQATNPVTRDEFDLLLEQFRDLTNRVQDFNRRSSQRL